jgi:hypothetical protein
MKSNMKRIFICLALFFAASSLFAQFSVHLNYSGATKAGMGIGYDFNNKLWGDLTFSRAFVAAYNISDISTDFSVNYNIVPIKRHDMYLGAGVLMDLYWGDILFTLPIGLLIRPFEKLNNMAFQTEIRLATDGGVYLFGNLGIRYRF